MRPARANMPIWREVREARVERLAAWAWTRLEFALSLL